MIPIFTLNLTLNLALLIIISFIGLSQNNDESLAFKKNRLQKKYNIFYQPDLSYQIQKQFNLIRDANAGNVLAQHELGLRYLLGDDGVEADTQMGAFWVKKAAEKNLAAACYNYGILLINGWGVEWNPFKAYDYFMKAADDGMPQAQHIIGILSTDNLIIKKNYSEAYSWIVKAADQNYKPAIETKKDLEKRIPSNIHKKTFSENKKGDNPRFEDESFSNKFSLIFIDFEAVYDSVKEIDDKELIEDLFHEYNLALADTMNINKNDSSLDKIDFSRILVLEEFASCGNPEALTLLGRLYEKGIFSEINLYKAASNYIQAAQLGYSRSKILLLKIVNNNFLGELNLEIKKQNNPDAMYVYYGLWALGLYSGISSADANKYLSTAAQQNHTPSSIELASNYYTGKFHSQSISKGIELWRADAAKGIFQARLRLSAVNIIDNLNIESLETSINNLNEYSKFGSVLAQIALAFANENGVGITENKAEAVKLYRLAAERGNLTAYENLKRMYDEIRPKEKRFIVN